MVVVVVVYGFGFSVPQLLGILVGAPLELNAVLTACSVAFIMTIGAPSGVETEGNVQAGRARERGGGWEGATSEKRELE